MFKFVLFSIVAIVVLSGSACAADRPQPHAAEAGTTAVKESFENIVALGPGVHHIKTDRGGRVRSCIVVGQARISTVLGTAKGLQMARTRARLAVAGEFVKWLRQEVDVQETIDDEAILSLEGSRKDSNETLQESGKAVEKNTVRFTAVSRGLIRGLQVLHVNVNGKDGVYTLVMGWSVDGAAAARRAAKDEGLPPIRKRSRKRNDSGRAIRSRWATSNDARKFLD